MRRPWMLLLPLMVLFPAHARAQTPMPPDIATLHRALFEMEHPGAPLPDPAAAQRLADWYLDGPEAVRDPVIGCGLLHMAVYGAVFRYYLDHPIALAATQIADENCEKFSDEERQAASRWMGCPHFGLSRPEIIEQRPGTWLEIGRDAVRIQRPDGTFDAERENAPCLTQVVLVRGSRVDPPATAALHSRELIETFEWVSRLVDGSPQRALLWRLEEIIGETVQPITMEKLLEERGTSWPAPPVPKEFSDGVAFLMNDQGEIGYAIGSEGQYHGRIGRLDGR